jgi:hypothetical protein
VSAARSKGIQPQRPSQDWVTDAHWEFIQYCWDEKPGSRPCAREVEDCIGAFHRECVNRGRCLTTATDGYETDYEGFQDLKQSARASGWQSENGSFTKLKRSTKGSRRTSSRYPSPLLIMRSLLASTLTLLKSVHSQRRTTTTLTTRMIDFRDSSSQRWKESIIQEISTLKEATHLNICNIIDFEGLDTYAIRLTLEATSQTSLGEILGRSTLTMDQISCLSSEVSGISCFPYGLDILFALDRWWVTTSP